MRVLKILCRLAQVTTTFPSVILITNVKRSFRNAEGMHPLLHLPVLVYSLSRTKNGKCLPILHNGSQIRVQPTSISRRKAGIKSSTATKTSLLKGM